MGGCGGMWVEVAHGEDRQLYSYCTVLRCTVYCTRTVLALYSTAVGRARLIDVGFAAMSPAWPPSYARRWSSAAPATAGKNSTSKYALILTSQDGTQHDCNEDALRSKRPELSPASFVYPWSMVITTRPPKFLCEFSVFVLVLLHNY